MYVYMCKRSRGKFKFVSPPYQPFLNLNISTTKNLKHNKKYTCVKGPVGNLNLCLYYINPFPFSQLEHFKKYEKYF